ncbi:MAG TPA: plastocyanin/azurin family copper-binding protein [Acidimicrobiia bacterium]|nr:plastocyanin/azurin family copper-binding protein [Acidimicrobiia bacterium]
MNRHRGGPWILTLILAAAFLMPASVTAASTTTVIERGTQYVPAQVDIHVGDTVQWIFESAPPASNGHTVTFSDRDLNPNCPPNLLLNDCQRGPSDRVARTFTAPGTYAYHCKVQSGMTGVVVVTAGTGSSSTTTTVAGSSTTATVRSTTTTTRLATSSTTSTTRVLATSSSVLRSTTTSSDPSSVLVPGAPPPFSDDTSASAAGHSGSGDKSDTTTVALIVGALLVVAAGGGYLLWRLRPGRAG